MKTILQNESMPLQLNTMNPDFNKKLRLKATRNILFLNYKPLDTTLGQKAIDNVIVGEKVEKEYDFKCEKIIKAMFDTEKNLLKIIPQKNTIDLSRALAPRLQKLQQRTELSIVEILKQKMLDIGKPSEPSVDGENGDFDAENGNVELERDGNNLEGEADAIVEEVIGERGQKEFDGKKYEYVSWVDSIQEKETGYEGDLVGQIDLMERMNELDVDDSEDGEGGEGGE